MEDTFNKINISYVDESLGKPTNEQIWKHYFSSTLIYFTIYIFLKNSQFFIKQISPVLLTYYVIFVLAYIFIAPILLYAIKPKSIHNSHSVAILSYITHLFKDLKIECFNDFTSLTNYLKPTYHQQQAIALFFVKVFFGVLMWVGVFNNINVLKIRMSDYISFFNTLNLQNLNFIEIVRTNSNFIFFNSILILFTIDMLVFAFGYITELECLKNKIRSIDTSFAGVFFCLCCYPPFNMVTTTLLGWSADEQNCIFGDAGSTPTLVLRTIAIFCLIIYVFATIALGTKASNLTNRGTVSSFPYNIIRHPAYISKNLLWLCMTIPILFTNSSIDIWHKILIMITFIFWAGIYYLRALTEERHLLKDPEYQAYVKKVKYRFIPYVF